MIERKWLVTIVVISVALNLLLVGFYIGQQPLPGRTNVSIDPTMGLPRVLQGLPEDRRRALLQDVDVSRREIASRHRALQKVQIDIERAMAMEPFDAESLANALENFRRRFDENQEDSHRLLVQLFEQIDPEERRAVRIASANSVRAQIKEDRAIWAQTAHQLDLTTIDTDRHAVARDVPGDLRAHGIGLRAVTDSEISTSLKGNQAKL